MKTLYKILGALALVLFGILLGVGYVWYSIAFAPKSIESMIDEKSEVQVDDSVMATTTATTSTAEPSMPVLKEPIHVGTTTLTKEQKDILKTLGVDADNLVITPAMQLCAVGALGEVRLGAIEKGATPTVSEALTLLVCYKK